MVRRSKGTRVKTRNILGKRPRNRGMRPITHTLRQFEEGEKANIIIDAAVHKGMPHRRYQGFTGTIAGKRGGAYLVDVVVGSKQKQLIIRPEHLKKAKL